MWAARAAHGSPNVSRVSGKSNIITSSLSASGDQPVRLLTVLVVDDRPETAESFAMLIAMDGHVALVAHHGRQALQLFAERKPDVVLLDLGLPEMDGYEVA